MTIKSPAALPAVHPFTGMDLPSVLSERAERFGDKPLLIWEPGPGKETATWTYAEFAAEVDALAAGLRDRGVERGDAVILLLENSPAFLMCWFACARVGAVAVNTNTRYASAELADAIGLTGAVGIVTHPHLLDIAKPAIDERWLVLVDESTGTCPELRGDPSMLAAVAPDPGAALCIQFTSGTTSRPKAVVYTHANALWGAKVSASHAGNTVDDVTLIYTPLFHTVALFWQFLATFWEGGTVVLLPRFTASRFWEISVQRRCTRTFMIGIMLTTLLEQETPDHHYRAFHFGLEIPELEGHFRTRFLNCWGMSEVITNVIVGELGVYADHGAIGRPGPEYSVRVTRPDGSDAPVGETGELLVGGCRGLSLFAGYHGDEAATADAFDEQGYFRTGDTVVVLPSGAIRFEGRLKDMLKVGGENVAAAEIERVLADHPGVAAAAVVGRPDRILDEVPVAFIVPRDPAADAEALQGELVALCRDQLADFKVPRTVHLLEELPEVTMGKIAKGNLREQAASLHAQGVDAS